MSTLEMKILRWWDRLVGGLSPVRAREVPLGTRVDVGLWQDRATVFYCGPYRNRPKDMPGIKLAEEIDATCLIDLPVRDFSTPAPAAMREALVKLLCASRFHREFYVGCMGGIGRTGLFVACVLKLEMTLSGRTVDPVTETRRRFVLRAIETAEQERFVRRFDVSELAAFVRGCQTAGLPGPGRLVRG